MVEAWHVDRVHMSRLNHIFFLPIALTLFLVTGMLIILQYVVLRHCINKKGYYMVDVRRSWAQVTLLVLAVIGIVVSTAHVSFPAPILLCRGQKSPFLFLV
jgi:hypothetical protein